jgi:peptidyl-dipeptidase A
MKRITLSASVVALCAALASCAADTTPATDEALVETPEIDRNRGPNR